MVTVDLAKPSSIFTVTATAYSTSSATSSEYSASIWTARDSPFCYFGLGAFFDHLVNAGVCGPGDRTIILLHHFHSPGSIICGIINRCSNITEYRRSEGGRTALKDNLFQDVHSQSHLLNGCNARRNGYTVQTAEKRRILRQWW